VSSYAGHNEDLRNAAEEQKKRLEWVGYFLSIPLIYYSDQIPIQIIAKS